MLYANDFRRIARQALTHHWAVAVVTAIVAGIFGAESSISTGTNFNFNGNDYDNNFGGIFGSDYPELRTYLFLIIMGVLLITAIWMLIYIFLGGPIKLGYVRFNKNLIEGANPQFGDLFSRFDMFWKGFVMQFLMALYTFLWTLLFIIPGLIASFSYAMTPYILEENPDMSVNEAIWRSKEMMRGNKWRLFCLYFSFIGWVFLCLLSCGIGTIVLNPYIKAAQTAFYYEISGKFHHQRTQQSYMNQNGMCM